MKKEIGRGEQQSPDHMSRILMQMWMKQNLIICEGFQISSILPCQPLIKDILISPAQFLPQVLYKNTIFASLPGAGKERSTYRHSMWCGFL